MADRVDFGRELSCTTSIVSNRFVTGARLVAESDFRRLTTPRGMLRGGEEEQNFGFDLMEYIGSVAISRDAASLPSRIRNELMKDDRHISVDATVIATTASNGGVAFDITINAKTHAGPFTMTIRASDVSVDLLGIST